MSLRDDVEQGVTDVLKPAFDESDAEVVPKTEDVVLRDGAKNINATYLYADMADSTGLAQGHKRFATAKVIRAYLNVASRIIRDHDGAIRSFDGDRVMAIYVGGSKNTNAVRTALRINFAVQHIINPALERKWNDLNWTMRAGVGIDTGEAMIVRGGVRGNNDLVSIGRAPNVAAKLSEIRTSYRIFITDSVYNNINKAVKFANGSDGVDMWKALGTEKYGGNAVAYRGTTYYQKF